MFKFPLITRKACERRLNRASALARAVYEERIEELEKEIDDSQEAVAAKDRLLDEYRKVKN